MIEVTNKQLENIAERSALATSLQAISMAAEILEARKQKAKIEALIDVYCEPVEAGVPVADVVSGGLVPRGVDSLFDPLCTCGHTQQDHAQRKGKCHRSPSGVNCRW